MIEGFAPTVRTQHPGLIKGDGHRRGQHDVDPAGQGHVATPAPDGFHSPMDGDQRTGAGRIDRFAGPVKIKEVRDTVRQNRTGHSGGDICIHFGQVFTDQLRIVVHGHPHKQTGLTAGKLRHLISRIFNGLPNGLKENSLLGIHQIRFPGRYSEKPAVELVHIRNESTPFGSCFIVLFCRIPVPWLPIPAIRRHFRDQIVSGFQMVPERLRVFRLRHNTAHSDDGDRLVLFRLV